MVAPRLRAREANQVTIVRVAGLELRRAVRKVGGLLESPERETAKRIIESARLGVVLIGPGEPKPDDVEDARVGRIETPALGGYLVRLVPP